TVSIVDDCISRRSKRTELGNAQMVRSWMLGHRRPTPRQELIEALHDPGIPKYPMYPSGRMRIRAAAPRTSQARRAFNTIHSNREVPWPSDGIEDGVLTRPNTRMTIAVASRTAPPIAIAIPIEALFGRPRIVWRRNPPATPPMPLNNARDARCFTHIDNVV